MASTHRSVRRLRLAAASAADARAVLPKLEDALRCASLPGDDQRLIIVRKLSLGRIAPAMTPQALSQLIEARVASAGWQLVHGDTAEATLAEAVWFAHPHQARQVLARRLLRQENVAQWYWPRAVPEYRPGQPVADNLRLMLAATARSAEASPALRALLGSMLKAGGSAALASALSAEQGMGLLHLCGMAMPPLQAASARSHELRRPGPATLPAAPVRSPRSGAVQAVPQAAGLASSPPWLQALARGLGLLGAAPPAAPMPASAPLVSALRDDAARAKGFAAGVQARPAAAPGITAAVQSDDVNVITSRGAPGAVQAPSLKSVAPPAGPLALPAARDHAAPRSVYTPSEFGAERWPSQCAGLLFLLQALRQLGYAEWVSHFPAHQQVALSSAILHAALQRLGATPEDAAWQLAGRAARQLLPRHVAPALWQHPSLRAPAGSRAKRLPSSGARRSVQRWADLWLIALRRYLRRQAQIGLASLIRRDGQLSHDATHIRVYLSLQSASLAVRRCGLDADPAWLPWFGRVTHFIYERGLP